MSKFFDKILPSTRFQKRFSFATLPSNYVREMTRNTNKGDCSGALLTDLSKAFHCILHDFLIAKLHAYGVDRKSLRFFYSYLNYRKQRVKINDNIVPLKKYNLECLRVLSFNIFISDLLLILKNIEILS